MPSKNDFINVTSVQNVAQNVAAYITSALQLNYCQHEQKEKSDTFRTWRIFELVFLENEVPNVEKILFFICRLIFARKIITPPLVPRFRKQFVYSV